jgi:hypothetical protein
MCVVDRIRHLQNNWVTVEWMVTNHLNFTLTGEHASSGFDGIAQPIAFIPKYIGIFLSLFWKLASSE